MGESETRGGRKIAFLLVEETCDRDCALMECVLWLCVQFRNCLLVRRDFLYYDKRAKEITKLEKTSQSDFKLRSEECEKHAFFQRKVINAKGMLQKERRKSQSSKKPRKVISGFARKNAKCENRIIGG